MGRRLRTVMLLLGLAVLSGVPREEAGGTGRSYLRPGRAGGSMLQAAARREAGRPLVFFVTDDSRSLAEGVVGWENLPAPRPLREAAVAEAPDRAGAVLLAAAFSPDGLPEAERAALESQGRYGRPGDGNDTWLPGAVRAACPKPEALLDGLRCRDHAYGLTADEVLRGTAALLWTGTLPWQGAADLAFVEAGRTADEHRIVHSMCWVRDDAAAPCRLPADRSVDGTVGALAGRASGAGRWSLAEALAWFRDNFLRWNDRAVLRAAADVCRPVVLVLGGDFTYKGKEVLAAAADALEDLRGPWSAGKVPAPLLRAVLVHTGDPADLEFIRAYLEGRGMGWVEALAPADLWADPLRVLPGGLRDGRGVGCWDRAWTVERPWGVPGLADRTDLVAVWDARGGGAVGRVGVRPWVDPGETNGLTDGSGREKVRWMTGPADWRERRAYVSYPKGGRMETVKVTDGNEAAVAADVGPLLGLSADAARRLLRFHRGDPAQEVDAGGAWRNRCGPWTGDCRTATEVLGAVLSPEQVVRAWRPTSGLSDFVLLAVPSWAERAAWPTEAPGRLYVGTSQGVTAYDLKTAPGSAPEEAWHYVPWSVLRNPALSAAPTSLPVPGPALLGFQVGDRRYLVAQWANVLTVLDVSRTGAGLHPDGPVVVFDSTEPGLPPAVAALADRQTTVARPVFAARPGPRGSGLDLEAVVADRAVGQVCVVQFPVSRRPGPADVARVCIPGPSGTLEWAGAAAGQNGYDVWLVFEAVDPAAARVWEGWWHQGGGPAEAPSVLVHWRADTREVRGAWALRMEFEWTDPVDGTRQAGLRAVLPGQVLVLPDEVVLAGVVVSRSRTPHGAVLMLWRPLLLREFPWTPGGPPAAVDVRPGSPRFYMASLSAADRSAEGFRVRWDGWRNRPWQSFCLRDGAPAMCVGWAYILRDLQVLAVEPPQGPPDWGIVPAVLAPWDCGDTERYLAWLPWPWLRSPVPARADDPGMRLGLDMRVFRPPAPEGYIGTVVSASAVEGGRLVQTAWRRPPPDDPWGGLPRWAVVLPSGDVVPQPALWPKGSFAPNVRAWRPGERPPVGGGR